MRGGGGGGGGGFRPGRRAAGHCSPPGSLCRRAKLLLKKKRYREQLLDKAESQISSLEAMVGWGPLAPGNPLGTSPSLPFLGAQPGAGEGVSLQVEKLMGTWQPYGAGGRLALAGLWLGGWGVSRWRREAGLCPSD